MNINLGLTAQATGTVDAITATYAPAVVLSNRLVVFLRTLGPNTLTNPTFQPNGVAVKPITKYGGDALAVGDLDGDVLMMYDLTNNRWELLNPKVSASVNIGNSDLTLTGDRILAGDGFNLEFNDLTNFTVIGSDGANIGITDGAGKSMNIGMDIVSVEASIQATDSAVGSSNLSIASNLARIYHEDDTAAINGQVEITDLATTIRHTAEIRIQTKEQIASNLTNNMFLKLVDETTAAVEFDFIPFEWDSHDNGDVVATGVTSFLCAKPGPSTDSATLNLRQNFISHACRVTTARIQTRTTQSAGGALTFTLQKNGVDTAMVISIAAGTAANVFSASFNVDFAAGDLVNWKVNNAGSGNSAAICAKNVSGVLL